ncbi:unnamed protein product [Oikopleura dioica]|uniref:Uncharacterized protein n=1 Tax=Oikopleura dioica TaxID=34765 RepID=E4Y4V2_OIKDI|nr:unnamed protein product [Oikopleura dioica]
MKIIHIFLFSEAFSGRIEKCNQVISFLEENGINSENRVFRRISTFKSQLFPLVKDRASTCGPEFDTRTVVEELEELDEAAEQMTFGNAENKMVVCSDSWNEYIQRKLPFDVCPKAYTKANRKLQKFITQLSRGLQKAHSSES